MLICHLIASVIAQTAQIAQTVDDMGWSTVGGKVERKSCGTYFIWWWYRQAVGWGASHVERTQRKKKKMDILKPPCAQKETGSKRGKPEVFYGNLFTCSCREIMQKPQAQSLTNTVTELQYRLPYKVARPRWWYEGPWWVNSGNLNHGMGKVAREKYKWKLRTPKVLKSSLLERKPCTTLLQQLHFDSNFMKGQHLIPG